MGPTAGHAVGSELSVLQTLVVVLGGFAGLFVMVRAARAQGPIMPTAYTGGDTHRAARPGPNPGVEADAAVLMLAVEGAERDRLQQRLAQLAAGADTARAEGLREVLRQASTLLRYKPSRFTHVGTVPVASGTVESVRESLHTIVRDVRGRYEPETVVNLNGAVATLDPNQLNAEPVREGALVVVLAVAARGKVSDLPAQPSARSLKRHLRRLGGIATARLLEVELLWCPAMPAECFTREEMEQRFPELERRGQ